MNSIRKKPGGRRWAEAFWTGVIYGAAGISLFLLLGLAGYVFWMGWGKVRPAFLLSASSAVKGTFGIGGNLLNSLYIIVMSLAFAVPAGVGAAVYLNEYASGGRLVRMAEFSLEILSGIPSVIFGLFGMVFFGRALGLGYSLLNGALTMTLMVLPLIVRNTQEALRAVPDSYRSGALGMGATKWHMIRTVLLPAAGPGILTGVTLSAGRIAGESAALLFTAGSAGLLPVMGENLRENAAVLRDKVFMSGGTLAVELYLQVQKGEFEAAFAVSCVLLLIMLLLNLLLRLTKWNR